MVSCSDDQEVVKLPQQTKVTPVEKFTPIDTPTDLDEKIPLSDEFLPMRESQDFENRETSERTSQEISNNLDLAISSGDKLTTDSSLEESVEGQESPVTTKAKTVRKVPDMGIMRQEAPKQLSELNK